MGFEKIFDLISQNNINPEDVFKLVEKVKTLDMKNEDNIRTVIHDVSKLTNKPIDKAKEDKLVKKILAGGINDDLLNFL